MTRYVLFLLRNCRIHLCLQERAIQLFHAFAPMLCKRPSHKVEDMVKELNAPLFIIEEKLDGERMQLHKRGNEYYYCSRLVVLVVRMTGC
jgi:DNA ligase-4